jgi:transcriptional regulator with XRE-family HTH domain
MLGDELRKIRCRAGLSQEELALRAGISREYVSILECNKKSPTVATLVRVCKALGVRAWQVIRKVEGQSGR